MRPAERMHPAFERALRRLATADIGTAEVHRRLIPVAERIGVPRPSYWRVREWLFSERPVIEARARRREAVLTQLAAGRVPRPEDLTLFD
jgi:hypothetical protein